MRPSLRALAAIACCCASLPAAALLPDRPLGVDTPGPLRALFLDMPLADARPAGEASVEVRWWMANSWSGPGLLTRRGRTVELQMDEQADALALAVRLPWSRLWPGGALARRLESGLEARLVQHWGGWSDGPIEAWHRLIRSDNFDREQHRRDRVALLLREPGGADALALSGPRLALGGVVIRNQVLLAGGAGPEPAWALAARLDVKLPAGRLASAGGSQRAEAGVALAASAGLGGRVTVHAQVSLRRISGLPGGLPFQPRPWQAAAEASLAVRLSEGWTAILEDRLLEALFAPGWASAGPGRLEASSANALLRPQNQISGGLRWRRLTIWVAEDFTPGRTPAGARWFWDSNAPDVVLGAALAWP